MDVAVFCVFALSLCLPSGYSYGALLLLLLGLARWPALLSGRLRWSEPMALWATAVVVMGLVWAMHLVDDQGRLITQSLGLDRCIKYLLVVLSLPALLSQRPSEAALRWGCIAGAVGAGLTGLWEVAVLHLPRADGYTNAIQFGNLALLLGVWSGIWALHAPSLLAKLAGHLGALAGLGASLASGSRGGWITLPVLLLLGFWLSRRPVHHGALQHSLRAVGATVLVCLAVSLLPPVQQRLELASHEYERQGQQSQDNSSVGLRMAFWRQAWTQGLSHPWVGAGQMAYEQAQRGAVSRGEMPSDAVQFNHAHNEALDLFAKRGLLGLLGLLGFYLVPGFLFWRGLRAASAPGSGCSDAQRAAALCGLVTVVGYLGFGMTQVMFAHNNGNLMYLLSVSIWLAVCWYGARPSVPRWVVAS